MQTMDELIAIAEKRKAAVALIGTSYKTIDHCNELLRLSNQYVRDCGHYDGTNMSEYECLECKGRWLAGCRVPCNKCHPNEYRAFVKVDSAN